MRVAYNAAGRPALQVGRRRACEPAERTARQALKPVAPATTPPPEANTACAKMA